MIMREKSNKKQFVIMSKDRKVIAKGTPRNRHLVLVSDTKDKKRILTYSSKGMAESAFSRSGFYTYNLPKTDNNNRQYGTHDLEAVEVNLTVTTID